jgi:hypothetical protein
MAKTTQNPVTPDFKDVDKEAVARAQAAIAGGMQDPLKVPKGAKVSTDKNGVEYSRWSERITITSAYRTVTESKLMDVVVIGKIRQSDKNNGSKVFGHFYLNHAAELPKGHDQMNDRSNGAIISLLQATGLMPAGGVLKASLLSKVFPSKGKPGESSPLNDKAVVANIVQTNGPKKDRKTRKPVVDSEGEPILEKRDSVESFLPDAPAKTDDEGE